MHGDKDSDEIDKGLVADMAFGLVPSIVMAVTQVAVGAYVYAASRDATVLAILVLNLCANMAKIAFNVRYRGPLLDRTATLEQVRRFEAGHATAVFAVAASIGALAAAIFRLPDVTLHLVATAMLFGYCASIVARLSVRPTTAIAALLFAAAPGTVAVAFAGGIAHQMVALIFLAFTLSSLETIRHVHRNARRHLVTRLAMADLARHDPLTSLLNRFGLREAFDALPRSPGRSLALHLFDLDGFKAVNDRLGHQTGDRLLELLADRLLENVAQGCLVARIGGDEFVVVQPDIEGEPLMMSLANRLHDMLSLPYGLNDDGSPEIGISLGCVMGSMDTQLGELVRRADQASYLAKRNGGGVRQADEASIVRAKSGRFQEPDFAGGAWAERANPRTALARSRAAGPRAVLSAQISATRGLRRSRFGLDSGEP